MSGHKEDGSDTQSHARTVAVTGATGFVGRWLVRSLLSHGWRVRALVRDVDAAARKLPDDERLELVEARALYKPAVPRGAHPDRLAESTRAPERVLEGVDAVIHLIGIIREARNGQTFDFVHVELTRRIVEACRAAGVKRYVHMSAIGVTSDGAAAYQRTKARAETIVRASGLDWTIFRPGLIHGPEGEFTEMCAAWVRAQKAPFVFVPYFTKFERTSGAALPPPRPEDPVVQPVSIDDLCAAFCESLEREDSIGEIYNLVGAERLTMREMLDSFRDNVPGAKKRIPIIGLPGPVMAMKARALGLIGLRDLLPFDEGMARLGSTDSVADFDKARADLGFEPGGFRADLKRYAGQL